MAKICRKCGKINGFWGGDPLELTDGVVLCYKCSEPIRNDLNNLYYTKTEKEYVDLRNRIIAKSRRLFNSYIVNCIISKTEHIYKQLNLTKSENISRDDFSVPEDMDFYEPVNSSNSSILFSNIGEKIKSLAEIITWIGIVLYVVVGIGVMLVNEDLIFIGIVIIVVGAFLSWISSFLLYAFGQLVDNSDKIVFELTHKE